MKKDYAVTVRFRGLGESEKTAKYRMEKIEILQGRDKSIAQVIRELVDEKTI